MSGRHSFAPASEFSLPRLAQAFNHAFTGYYLPMTQTPAALAEMIRVNDVQLDASRVLLLDGAVAGIGLVGLRVDRAWIAGMGIGPRWRSQGYGRALLEALLDAMRAARARLAQLEALSVNTPALALYESMGFRDVRELRVYQGQLTAHTGWIHSPDVNARGRLAPVALRAALESVAARRVIAPSWQREPQSLGHMRRRISGMALWEGERALAYAMYARHDDDLLLFDAQSTADSPESQRADVIALIRSLSAGQRAVVARAINVPAGDALGSALDGLGCAVVARQREMSRAL
jgi:ribosomal protein S18 acetylase RimI-like enzyme